MTSQWRSRSVALCLLGVVSAPGCVEPDGGSAAAAAPCTLEEVSPPECESCPPIRVRRFDCKIDWFVEELASLEDGSFYGTLVADSTETRVAFRTGEGEQVLETAARGVNLVAVQNADAPTFYLREGDEPVRSRDLALALTQDEAMPDRPYAPIWAHSAELRNGAEVAIYTLNGESTGSIVARHHDATGTTWTEFESEDFAPRGTVAWSTDGVAQLARKVGPDAVVGALDETSEPVFQHELDFGWWGNWRVAFGSNGRIALGLPDRDKSGVLLVEGVGEPARTVAFPENFWEETAGCNYEPPCTGSCRRVVRHTQDRMALYLDSEGVLVVTLDDLSAFTHSTAYEEEPDACFDGETWDLVEWIEIVGRRVDIGDPEPVEVFRIPLLDAGSLVARFAVAGDTVGILVTGYHTESEGTDPHLIEVDVSGFLVR